MESFPFFESRVESLTDLDNVLIQLDTIRDIEERLGMVELVLKDKLSLTALSKYPKYERTEAFMTKDRSFSDSSARLAAIDLSQAWQRDYSIAMEGLIDQVRLKVTKLSNELGKAFSEDKLRLCQEIENDTKFFSEKKFLAASLRGWNYDAKQLDRALACYVRGLSIVSEIATSLESFTLPKMDKSGDPKTGKAEAHNKEVVDRINKLVATIYRKHKLEEYGITMKGDNISLDARPKVGGQDMKKDKSLQELGFTAKTAMDAITIGIRTWREQVGKVPKIAQRLNNQALRQFAENDHPVSAEVQRALYNVWGLLDGLNMFFVSVNTQIYRLCKTTQ